MNRRMFLEMMSLVVLDPEKLLYLPGEKMISIPKPEPIGILRVIPLTFYVSMNGNDLWDGLSPATAKRTITEAFRLLQVEHDRMIIGDGGYFDLERRKS